METALIPNHLFLLPEHLSASDRNPATAKPNFTLNLNNPTLACLEQCTSMSHLRQLHALMITSGLARDAFASSRLIAFCGLSLRGDLPYALKLFSLLPSPPTLFLWNLIIRSLSRTNRPDLSLRFYVAMLRSRCVPDTYTFPFLLKSCSHLSSPEPGLQVHAHVVKNGLDTDPHASNSLVGMYSEFGLLEAAKTAFARTSNGDSRDQVSLATMIGGLIRNGRPEEAIALFSSKNWRDWSLDQITLATVLSACARVGNLKLGNSLHAYIEENRVELGLLVRNSLINMYAKCGELAAARTLFDTTADKDSVSWNVMISGLAENGLFEEGLELFAEMKKVNADRATFLALATSCNNLCSAKRVHGHVTDTGFASDVPICNALIDMYSRIGHVELGRRVFDEMQDRDVVSWNSMIAGYTKCGSVDAARSLFAQMPRKDNVSWSTMILGYVRNGRPKEAIAVYKDLQSDGSTAPDAVTVLSVLTACSALGALEEGASIHSYIRSGSSNIRIDGPLATALIDMYAKCGQLGSAVEVFESVPRRDKDVHAWTAMISGHATHGDAEGALEVFERMLPRTRPNAVTFLAVLSACAHAGRVEEGRSAYRRMVEEYGLEPGLAHLGCMVDLLGRAGKLEEALGFIEEWGYEEVDASVWGALLGACRIHGDAEMGMMAARRMIGLEPRHDGAFVSMCNIYAEGLKWEERKEVRMRMREEMVAKEVGMSWIEVNGTLHEFTAGNIYS